MKRRLYVIKELLFALASVSLVSCEEEINVGSATGKPVRFGVSTSYDNGVATRTEYSGDLIGSNPRIERINWVVDTDRIRILCEESPENPCYADYTITSATNADGQRNSDATVEPSTGNGLTWGDASADHYFYALYPAATMDGVVGSEAVIAAAEGNKATVTGRIPASQTATWDASKRIFKPDMNYAYMFAKAKVSPSASRAVELPFQPLMIAFEFSLVTDSTFPISTTNLTSVELTSATTELAGNFVASLSETGVTGTPVVTDGTKKLTIEFPDGGVLLSQTDPVHFTFLALPVPQTDLTVTLHFGNGTHRSLALKESGNSVSIDACKKLYITNVNVPAQEVFIFEVDDPGVDTYFSYDGETRANAYTVRSYMQADAFQRPVSWTAVQYFTSFDDGLTWTETAEKPDWFSFTDHDDVGSVEGTSYAAGTGPNNSTVIKTWTDTDATPQGSASDPVDLSFRDIYGKVMSAQNTANCYVVSKPGWYKLPLVYGNAIENGGDNTDAYDNDNPGPFVLNQFLAHDGSPIQGPYITDQFTVDGATLCWSDFTDSSNNPVVVVDDVQIDGTDLVFHVGDNIIQGNALVAATSGGTIVWSWHIWVIETEKLKAIPMANGEQMLNHNLGWYDADETIPRRAVRVILEQDESHQQIALEVRQNAGDVFGGNLFYQWGRKDPMLGFTASLEQKGQYFTNPELQFRTEYAAYETYEEEAPDGVIVNNGRPSTSLADAIQHPYIFYGTPGLQVPTGYRYDEDQGKYTQAYDYISVIYSGRWHNARYDDLWNANVTFGTDTDVVKTVYDPSPVGFKMARYDSFVDLGTRVASLGFGYLFQTTEDGTERMMFPALSLREFDTGALRPKEHAQSNNQYQVFIWNAGKHLFDDGNGNHLYGSTGAYLQMDSSPSHSPHTTAGPDAYGFAVRPVVDNP